MAARKAHTVTMAGTVGSLLNLSGKTPEQGVVLGTGRWTGGSGGRVSLGRSRPRSGPQLVYVYHEVTNQESSGHQTLSQSLIKPHSHTLPQ